MNYLQKLNKIDSIIKSPVLYLDPDEQQQNPKNSRLTPKDRELLLKVWLSSSKGRQIHRDEMNFEHHSCLNTATKPYLAPTTNQTEDDSPPPPTDKNRTRHLKVLEWLCKKNFAQHKGTKFRKNMEVFWANTNSYVDPENILKELSKHFEFFPAFQQSIVSGLASLSKINPNYPELEDSDLDDMYHLQLTSRHKGSHRIESYSEISKDQSEPFEPRYGELQKIKNWLGGKIAPVKNSDSGDPSEGGGSGVTTGRTQVGGSKESGQGKG